MSCRGSSSTKSKRRGVFTPDKLCRQKAVSEELLRLDALTGVMRAQLQNTVELTETSALDIVTRLHEIDAVVDELDRLITSRNAETEQQLLDTDAVLVRNRQLLERMGHYIDQRREEANNDRLRIQSVTDEARALGDLVALAQLQVRRRAK